MSERNRRAGRRQGRVAAQQYLELVKTLREALPECFVTSDGKKITKHADFTARIPLAVAELRENAPVVST